MKRACDSGRQRGAALILVLWTFAALTALAGEFARAMRQDAQSTRNFKEETVSHYIAVAAINEALYAIQIYNGELDVEDGTNPPIATGRENDRAARRARERAAENVEEDDPRILAIESLLVGRGAWVEGEFAGVKYEVRAVEESGKVPLNESIVDAALITRIMENLGYERLVAETVADSIVDWRDEDDLHGVNGAEDQYYEGLDRPYQSKDAPFDSTDELLLVRGVTRDIYYGTEGTPGLRDVFYANDRRQRRLTPRAMGPAVEHALCGNNPNDEGSGGDGLGAGARGQEVDVATCLQEVGFPVARGGSEGKPRLGTASVEARVSDDSGRVLTHIGTTVQFSRQGSFRTMRWYDAVFSDEG